MKTLLTILLIPFHLAASLYLAPDLFYRDFQEESGLEAKSEERGWLAGFQAGGDFCLPWLPYAAADLRFAEGKTRFNGTIQNQILNKFFPFQSQTQNTLLNLEGRLGYTLAALNFQASPFLGLGWHGWMRQAENRSVGYDEYYRWCYLSLGAHLKAQFSSLSLGLKANAMHTTLADVQIRGVYSWPIFLNSSPLWQYEAELPLSFQNQSYAIFWVGYFRYLPIGKTNTQKTSRGEIFIPPSKTYVWGNRLELTYLF